MTIAAAEGHLVSPDGLKLFYRRWDAPQPRAICLLVHGLAEHSGRYVTLAETLANRRFSVWALDHRGHGRSEGRRGDCRSLQEFVQDLRQFSLQAHAAVPSLPLILIGHSLGGLIVFSFAATYPDEVRAVAASSPSLRLTHETPPLKVALVTGVARIAPTASFGNGVNPRLLCRDPQVVEAYVKDPLVHHVITARCALALRHAMQQSMQLATQLKIPCLLMQAGADEVCDPEAAAEFSKRAADSLVTFRRYEGLYHELFNEPQRQQILSDLCAWIDQVLHSC